MAERTLSLFISIATYSLPVHLVLNVKFRVTVLIHFHHFSIRNQPKMGKLMEFFIYKYEDTTQSFLLV